MADLSQYSTEQLKAMLAQSGGSPAPATPSPATDLFSIPTDQLKAMLAQHPDTPNQEPGILSQIGHQLGLAGRYAIEGPASVLGIVSDPVGQFLPGYEKTGQLGSSIADAIGLPKPQGKLEEGVGAASKALTGTAATMGAGLAAEAPQLAAQPLQQALGSIFGAGGADLAKEKGVGEGGQAAIGALASLVPGAASTLPQMAVKGALRGASGETMAKNIENFAAAGTTPSVGQASESGLSRGLESLLAKLPGSSGVMARKAASQADDMGTRMGSLADSLAPGSDPTTAGEAIQRGIAGEGGFVDRFKQQAGQLYDQVDQHMPPTTPVPLKSTIDFLGKATSTTAGAEATSSLLANPKLAAIAKAVGADTAADGTVPYTAVKALRSRVGDMLADSGLTADVPKAQLKQLYGALSNDMRATTMATSPEAAAANNAAENFYRNGMGQIDKVESVVGRNGGPEKIFQAATSGTREGASTLNNVMSMLQPDEANVVTSAVLRRMGRANPSAQNDIGDNFSTQTFLSNWAGMSPQAKQVLFSRGGDEFRANLDKIASVTSNLREGSKVYVNPSGTASSAAQIGTAGALGTAVVTGNLPAAAAIVGGLGATNMSARLMTNPTFVKWLARNTTAPMSVLPAQIGYLSQLGDKDPDLKQAAAALGQQLGQ